eukprot:TRINITY_DN10631_c0_g1_i1.p1 TRINITY_DN10631_c0_g1~~TRINITY_DN10631_c0_g1_i1.p1  ORF type:complete len:158 (+),score=31.64 TRINITY_DN10631_c0_g1_i1:80-553(+)
MSSMDVDEDQALETVTKLGKQIEEIEEHLKPFFSMPTEELSGRLSESDMAKLHVVVAYTINTLFYLYMKLQGMDPNNHAVKKELERVRLYITKVKELTDKSQPALKIDKDAAKRFIIHSTNTPTPSAVLNESEDTASSPVGRTKSNGNNKKPKHTKF